jgi:hypothetical protein
MGIDMGDQSQRCQNNQSAQARVQPFVSVNGSRIGSQLPQLGEGAPEETQARRVSPPQAQEEGEEETSILENNEHQDDDSGSGIGDDLTSKVYPRGRRPKNLTSVKISSDYIEWLCRSQLREILKGVDQSIRGSKAERIARV